MTSKDYDWSIVPLKPAPLTMGHIHLLNLARHQANNTLIVFRHSSAIASSEHVWSTVQSQEMIERWCASQSFVPAFKFAYLPEQSSNDDFIELVSSNTSGDRLLLSSSPSVCDKFNKSLQNVFDCHFVTPAKDKTGAAIHASKVRQLFVKERSLADLQRELSQLLELGVLHYSTYQWLHRYTLNMRHKNTKTGEVGEL